MPSSLRLPGLAVQGRMASYARRLSPGSHAQPESSAASSEDQCPEWLSENKPNSGNSSESCAAVPSSPASMFEGGAVTPSTTVASSSGSATPRVVRVCRYCFEDDETEGSEGEGNLGAFVIPCPCRGSSKFVHMRCLAAHFLAQAEWHNFKCPTCKLPYEGAALLELARLSKEKMLEDYGPRSPQLAQSLCHLAQAHAQLGHAAASKELLEQGLVIAEEHFGPGHVATASTLAELASAHGKLGDVKKQKELLERSLQIKEDHFGAGHINTAVTLNNLATVHSELGNLQREKDLLERSLEIKEKHYGKGHVQTTAALVNLAGVYSELGESQKGLQLLETSLRIEERHFGVGHVETAITLNNLALAYGEAGDVLRMRNLLLKSLTIKENHFGHEHQELCLTLANLGMACAALKEMDASRSYCHRALILCHFEAAPVSRRHGIVLLRTATVQMSLHQVQTASELVGMACNTLDKALGWKAGHRILNLECTRMARIWSAVHRPDVVAALEQISPTDLADQLETLSL